MIGDKLRRCRKICDAYDKIASSYARCILHYAVGFLHPLPRWPSRKQIAEHTYSKSPDKVWRHREAQQTLDNHKRLQEWMDK